MKKKPTPAGFEPALPKEMPTYLSYNIAGHRVNHSAKAPCLVDLMFWLFGVDTYTPHLSPPTCLERTI